MPLAARSCSGRVEQEVGRYMMRKNNCETKVMLCGPDQTLVVVLPECVRMWAVAECDRSSMDKGEEWQVLVVY